MGFYTATSYIIIIAPCIHWDPVAIIDTLEKAIMESGKRSHPPLGLKRKQMQSPAVWAEGRESETQWAWQKRKNQCNLGKEQRWVKSFSSRVLHLKHLPRHDTEAPGLKCSICDDQICLHLLKNQLNGDNTINQSYSDKLLIQAWWGNVENLVNKDKKLT